MHLVVDLKWLLWFPLQTRRELTYYNKFNGHRLIAALKLNTFAKCIISLYYTMLAINIT